MILAKTTIAIAAMILAATLLFVGCNLGGSSNSDDSHNDVVIDVSGSWSVTKTVATGPDAGRSGTGIFNLNQDGNRISGTAEPNAQIEGFLSGATIDLTIIAGSMVDTWTGTVSGNRMSGTWFDNEGDAGTWVASR